MTIYHVHHIVPKHCGGTDDPSNLVRLTIEQHAEAHKKLWEEHGRWEDRIAWLALSGQISKQEIIKQKLIESGSIGGKTHLGKPRTDIVWNKGVSMSSDVREKISNTRKEMGLGKKAAKNLPKLYGEKNHMKSPEHRKRMSELASTRYRIYNQDGTWTWGYKS